jgi:hypothetical protein
MSAFLPSSLPLVCLQDSLETFVDDPDAEIFAITVDGTDFRTWKTKHVRCALTSTTPSHKELHQIIFGHKNDIYRTSF